VKNRLCNVRISAWWSLSLSTARGPSAYQCWWHNTACDLDAGFGCLKHCNTLAFSRRLGSKKWWSRPFIDHLMLHVLRYQRKYYVFFGYTASMSILSVMNVFWKIFELHPVTRLIKQCNILFDNPLFWSQRLFEMIFMNRKGVYNFFSQSEKTWPISGNWFSPFQGSCKSQVSRYKWSLDSESRLLKRDVCILKLNSIYIYILDLIEPLEIDSNL